MSNDQYVPTLKFNRVYVDKDFPNHAYRLYFLHVHPGTRQRTFIKDVVVETVNENDPIMHQNPEFVIMPLMVGVDDAQQMMDAMWDAGLRPSQHTGAPEQIAATNKHISDLRKITFAQLDIQD